ncbi:MAG: hypothetical protein JSS81_11640 [Acidobacteria bacterium]|nr:hypothetical protein [Acidobacteriota bacterium]
MMQTELIDSLIHLPVADRIEIIERISRSLREDLVKKNSGDADPDERETAYFRLRGIAAVEGKTPPDDERVREDFLNHLSEKYK